MKTIELIRQKIAAINEITERKKSVVKDRAYELAADLREQEKEAQKELWAIYDQMKNDSRILEYIENARDVKNVDSIEQLGVNEVLLVLKKIELENELDEVNNQLNSL